MNDSQLWIGRDILVTACCFYFSGLTFVLLFPLLLWPDSGTEWGVSSASQDQLLGGCNSFQAEFELVIANNDDMGVTVSLIQMTFSLLPGPPGFLTGGFLFLDRMPRIPHPPPYDKHWYQDNWAPSFSHCCYKCLTMCLLCYVGLLWPMAVLSQYLTTVDCSLQSHWGTPGAA